MRLAARLRRVLSRSCISFRSVADTVGTSVKFSYLACRREAATRGVGWCRVRPARDVAETGGAAHRERKRNVGTDTAELEFLALGGGKQEAVAHASRVNHLAVHVAVAQPLKGGSSVSAHICERMSSVLTSAPIEVMAVQVERQMINQDIAQVYLNQKKDGMKTSTMVGGGWGGLQGLAGGFLGLAGGDRRKSLPGLDSPA